jgi:hypothetical protein
LTLKEVLEWSEGIVIRYIGIPDWLFQSIVGAAFFSGMVWLVVQAARLPGTIIVLTRASRKRQMIQYSLLIRACVRSDNQLRMLQIEFAQANQIMLIALLIPFMNISINAQASRLFVVCSVVFHAFLFIRSVYSNFLIRRILFLALNLRDAAGSSVAKRKQFRREWRERGFFKL